MTEDLEQINSQLERSIEVKRKAERMESMLEKHLRDQDRLLPKVEKLRARVEAEVEDVEKLRRLSFRNMLATVLRQKEKWEQKEWQEYLEADLKYTRNQQQLDEAKQEVARLRGLLGGLGEWRKQHQDLLEQKEQLLKNSTDPSALKLTEFRQKRAEAGADIQELKEAIAAGNDALEALQPVAEKLSSARNWGVWDMAGGGMISSMIKQNKLDGARNLMLKAQQKLDRFRNELEDVGDNLDHALDLSVTMRAMDMFFDNIFVDLMVQSKIRKSQEQCERAIQDVSGLVKACQSRLSTTQERFDRLGHDHNRLLESI